MIISGTNITSGFNLRGTLRVPDAPTIGTAFIVSNTSANVSFTAPIFTGDTPITGYTAIAYPGGIRQDIYSSGSGVITVNGLTDNTTYTFSVTANNTDGPSVNSSSSNSITTNSYPPAPTINYVELTSISTANIVYTAPTYNGNSTITSYTAVNTVGGTATTVNTANSGNITITGLSPNVSHSFSVYAVNEYGKGILSNPSSNIFTYNVPGAPTVLYARSISGTAADIVYTAPDYIGNSAIISYTARSIPGNVTATVNSGNITVGGLSINTNYTFAVSATNSAGSGNATISNSVQTLTVPNPPIMAAWSTANNIANISYIAPSYNGGEPILSYTLVSVPENRTVTVLTSNSGSILMPNLNYGTTYVFAVYATNSVGSSKLSAFSNYLSILPPVSPYLGPTVMQVLAVAGGGGGGNGGPSAYESGGGGAGGLIYHPTFSSNAGTYTISVGGAGAYNTNGGNSTISYNNGSNLLIAIGGAAGSQNGSTGFVGGSGGGGTHNGSAGGAGVQTTNQSIPADSRTYGFGNGGGNGTTSAGAGGGGAGAAGTNAAGPGSGGPGGIGRQYDISGTSTYYAGGGGGGVSATSGGLGGGGAGTSGGSGNPGTINTGGGGGGVAGSAGSIGGNGGTGVVILRYLDTFVAANATTGNPNVIVSGGYRSYRFWQSGSISFDPTFPPPYFGPSTVEYLVVGGGGGGGTDKYDATRGAGGGGAGGYLTGTTSVSAAITYTVAVGGGGAGSQNIDTLAGVGGTNGANSEFSGFIAIGGGRGSGHTSSGGSPGSSGTGGATGGSAGGGANGSASVAGTAGQGNASGTGSNPPYNGGGGGGAGGAGSGMNGGAAVVNAISGTSVSYAGGGAAWGDSGYGTAGTNAGSAGGNGVANTGGGGGAIRNAVAGSGGSGIVIIRYADTFAAATSTTGSPDITVAGGYRVYKWTTVGNWSITF